MAEITVHDLLSWEQRIMLPESLPNDGVWTTGDRLLEREVSWAVTLRASMPILPPIRGGELVILPDRILMDTGVSAEEIVREVANRGATGLIVERFIPAPSSLISLWAETIPADLESDINRMLTEQRGEIYRAGTELGRSLTQVTALGADVEDVLKTASDYLGFGVAVVSARDGVVASAGESSIETLPSAGDVTGWQGDLFGLPLAHGSTLWLGAVPAGKRAMARLVSERVGMAVEAAMAHAVDVRPRGNARAHAIAGLLTDAGSDASKMSAALGLPSNGAYAVVLSHDGSSRGARAREIALLGAAHDAAEVDGFNATLIELSNRTPRMSTTLSPGLTGRGARVATEDEGWMVVSEQVTGVSRIPAAARQARYLAALVSAGMVQGGQIHFDRPADVGVYRLLFPLWGSPELEAFSRDTLGQLLTRDRRGNLRRTLLAYLEAGGSQVEAAGRLNVHRNTLAYRLRQIAEMTGADPTRPQSHLALHMALLASVLPPAPVGQSTG